MTAPLPVLETSELDSRAVIAAVAGGLLVGLLPARPAVRNALLAAAGVLAVGALVRGPTIRATERAGIRRRTVNLRFSFVVEEPVPRVFAFCSNFENFPQFIAALCEVKDTGDGRSHWRAESPTGETLEWDAVTTKYMVNSVIGWRSVPEAPVDTTGLVRFTPDGEHTCVRVAVCYSPRTSEIADTLMAIAQPRRGESLERDIRQLERYVRETSPA